MIEQNPLARKIFRQLSLILFAAFIVKIIFVFAITTELLSDSFEYYELGKNLFKLGEYSFDGKITALRAWGYPLFISGVFQVFGEGQIGIKVIQSFLEIFGGIFFFLTCRYFLSDKKALLAVLVFSFLPSNLLYSQIVLSESLFGTLFLIIIYYCVRENFNNKILFIGIIWGYAVLVRSAFALSVILIPLFIILYRHKLFEGYKKKRIYRAVQYIIMFVVGIIIVLAPWLIRNKIQFGEFTLATQGGLTFWAGNNENATGTAYFKLEESHPLFNMKDEIRQDKEFYKLGFDYAIHNPVKFAVLGIKKIGYVLSSERMILLCFAPAAQKYETSTDVYKAINPFWLALVNVPYFLIMLFGIWGLVFIGKKKFIIYGFLAVWAVTFVLYIGLARYHYVLIPFFVLGTVIFISERKNIFQKKNWLKILIAVIFDLFLLSVWAFEAYLMYLK